MSPDPGDGLPNGRDLEHRLRLVGILQLTEGDELSRVRRLALTHADNSPHRLGAVLERTLWNTPAKRRTKSQKLAQEALESEVEEARAAGRFTLYMNADGTCRAI